MNGVHDMGGMSCHGPVEVEENEPIFHSDWERRVLGLVLAAGATGQWNLDISRYARESLPPSQYLSIGYYRIWLLGLEKLLLQSGMISEEELASGRMEVKPIEVNRVLQAADVDAALAAGSPVTREPALPAQFASGQSVRVKNYQPTTHTRLPAYIRGHIGKIVRVHGCHVFPDSHALGLGEDPRWLYCVRFDADELWGERAESANGAIHVDCWEPYLQPVNS